MRNLTNLSLQSYNGHDLCRVFAAFHTGFLEWAIYIVNIVYNRADIPHLKQPNSVVISVVSGQTAQCIVQVIFFVIRPSGIEKNLNRSYIGYTAYTDSNIAWLWLLHFFCSWYTSLFLQQSARASLGTRRLVGLYHISIQGSFWFCRNSLPLPSLMSSLRLCYSITWRKIDQLVYRGIY